MYQAIKYVFFLGLACVVLLELALRIYNPIYVPMRADQIELPVNRVFTQRNTNNPKVSEFQTYRYNEIGLRGPAYPENPEEFTKIITVGGSTTACVELSDGDTWPDQLLLRLNQASDTIWLNNAGQNGHSTFGHLILLDQHLKKHRPDILLYLLGANEVSRSDLNSFDAAMIGRDQSLKKRVIAGSELLSTAQVIRRSVAAYDLGVNAFFPLDITEVYRAEMTPEALETELSLHREKFIPGYRARLEELIQRSQEAGALPVFMTQPALYGPGIDETTGIELTHLRTSREGLPAYAEWQVLELYNDVTRAVASQHGLLVIDLATLLAKDSAYFFDWIHYSNAGAIRVAEIVESELLQSGLLAAAVDEPSSSR